MNKNWIPACLLVALAACKTGNDISTTITVSNPSEEELTDKPVVIARQSFTNMDNATAYPLVTTPAGDTIAAQLNDINRDGEWDQLFFVADFKAGEEKKFLLKWNPNPVHSTSRSHIRFGVRQTEQSRVEPALSDTFYADQLPGVIGYQHYQTDGPTWENDKVGFRIYLDGRNSFDVFGKKVSYITSDSIGIGKDGHTENNYSEMKDWGMDILGVGNSAGIGGISLQIKDSLVRLGVTEQDSLNNVDTTICNVISNGPVYSQLNFDYHHWRSAGRDYDASISTSIWPGMYAFQNTVQLKRLQGDETLLIGLVNSNTTKQLEEIPINDQWIALITHDKQSINKTWYMGLALILPKQQYLGFIEAPKQGKLSNTFLARMKAINDLPLTYYAVATWELSDSGFADAGYFKKYVTQLGRQLNTSLKITVN